MPELNFDVWDSAVLTDLIRRPLETAREKEATIGEQIAPLVPVNSREVKVEVREVNAFGVGQYKAPGATPPLYEPSGEWQETVMELVLLEEMHRIKDEDWLALQSSDEKIRRRAGLEIVERGQILAIRNRRLTEKMRWSAFTDALTVSYQSGSTLEVNYGLPAGHTPTASTLWSDTANADPVADIEAWSDLIGNKVGHYGTKVHLSSNTWRYIRDNDAVAAKLTGEDRPLLLPTVSDVTSLIFREGFEFVITDAGYRDTGEGTDRGYDAVTQYLPDGKVLITTPYVIDGERIADVPDGQVLVQDGYNSVDIRRGPQAEVLLENISKTHFLRYASARIPRIHHPGAFVYATVA